MRPAHSLFYCTALWMGSALTLPAAASEPAPASVFDPAAPTQPLQHPPLPASGPIVDQPGDWKAANAAVAQFPRGHADVVKREKSQAKAADQAAPDDTHSHHHHGGQP